MSKYSDKAVAFKQSEGLVLSFIITACLFLPIKVKINCQKKEIKMEEIAVIDFIAILLVIAIFIICFFACAAGIAIAAVCIIVHIKRRGVKLSENGEIEKATNGEYNNVYYYASRWYFCRYEVNEKGVKDRKKVIEFVKKAKQNSLFNNFEVWQQESFSTSDILH